MTDYKAGWNEALRTAARDIRLGIEEAQKEAEPPANFIRVLSAMESSILARIDAPSQPAAPANPNRLLKAAETGLSYAEDWVEEHGGIDGCDMNDRLSLEELRAAVAEAKAGK